MQPASATASDGAHPAAAHPVLTFTELSNRKQVPNMGGKAACTKQRELRAICLSRRQFQIDLTDDAWSWRDLLRSLPPQLREDLVGPGVTQFTFRLLKKT